jgi:hypothetical protein
MTSSKCSPMASSSGAHEGAVWTLAVGQREDRWPTRDYEPTRDDAQDQYFEIFGNRAIYHDGWMANTVPAVIPCVTAPREPAIATARDSWSRMVPSPLGMVRAPALPLLLPRPAAMLLGGPLLQRASVSSEPASSAGPPPAGPREPGWARAAARHLRHQPPDAPIRSVAGSRSA